MSIEVTHASFAFKGAGLRFCIPGYGVYMDRVFSKLSTVFFSERIGLSYLSVFMIDHNALLTGKPGFSTRAPRNKRAHNEQGCKNG